MNELPTAGLRTISAAWELIQSSPPMWRCTWRSDDGTVVGTWEIANGQFYPLRMNLDLGKDGQAVIHVAGFVATPSGHGDDTCRTLNS
jgi:hypothetical protein